MPNETKQAVEWSIQVCKSNDKDCQPWTIVDLVRQYFNDNNIECRPMSFDDLKSFIK